MSWAEEAVLEDVVKSRTIPVCEAGDNIIKKAYYDYPLRLAFPKDLGGNHYEYVSNYPSSEYDENNFVISYDESQTSSNIYLYDNKEFIQLPQLVFAGPSYNPNTYGMHVNVISKTNIFVFALNTSGVLSIEHFDGEGWTFLSSNCPGVNAGGAGDVYTKYIPHQNKIYIFSINPGNNSSGKTYQFDCDTFEVTVMRSGETYFMPANRLLMALVNHYGIFDPITRKLYVRARTSGGATLYGEFNYNTGLISNSAPTASYKFKNSIWITNTTNYATDCIALLKNHFSKTNLIYIINSNSEDIYTLRNDQSGNWYTLTINQTGTTTNTNQRTTLSYSISDHKKIGGMIGSCFYIIKLYGYFYFFYYNKSILITKDLQNFYDSPVTNDGGIEEDLLTLKIEQV